MKYSYAADYFTTKNIPHIMASGGTEVQLNCFKCEDTNGHLYVNNENGCFLCHKCQFKGNWSQLLQELGETEQISLSQWTLVEKKAGKVLDTDLITKYHQALTGRIITYLQSESRGLSLDSIDKYLLGWDGYSITIPVFNARGDLINIRHRRDPEKPGEPKIWGEKGCPVSLFNIGILPQLTDFVVIAEGEFDAMVLNQHGFPAVSSTGGAGTFYKEWVQYFTNIKIIYVCYDTDAAGTEGTLKVAQLFGDRARVVQLPQLSDTKTDTTDYFAKKNPQDFQTLLDQAVPLTPEQRQMRFESNKKDVSKTIQATFLHLDGEQVAEQIVDNTGACSFLVFDARTGQTNQVNSVSKGGGTYIPLHGDLVTKHVVRFPSQATPFTTFEDLYTEVKNFIHRYADMDPFFLELATYYVFLTWLFDTVSTITYLGIFSPDRGVGKTRIAKTIGAVCYKPMYTTGSITPAVIYRLLEKVRGTLVLNEFDFDNSDLSSEIIRILNNGYEKGLPVLRVEMNGSKIEAFDAFGPKIFTYRRKKKDQAFESRLVTLPAEETTRNDIPIELPSSFWDEALALRNKLLFYRFTNYAHQSTIDATPLNGLERRLRQTLFPLLRVIPDQVFLTKLVVFAKDYQETLNVERQTSWVADAVRVLVDLTTKPDVITVKLYAEHLTKMKVFENKEDAVSSRKAGSIVRTHLKLKTERLKAGPAKGQYEIVIDAQKIIQLCEKYGVDIPVESSLHSLPSPSSSQESEHSERSEGSQEVKGGVHDYGDF